jgi:hypothetical protein
VTTRRAGRAYYVIKPVREALILDQPGGAAAAQAACQRRHCLLHCLPAGVLSARRGEATQKMK